MSRFTQKFRGGVTALQLSSKSLLLLLIICLFAFAATALAQDDDAADSDVPDPIILSEKVLPYGVQTVTRIYTDKDAFIASGQPSTKYGGWTTMRMGYEGSSLQAVRALMRFNLSSIPSNSQVNNATMGIYQSYSNPSNDSPMGFQAQYMTADWSEANVTWNNANYLGGAIIGIGNNTSALGMKYSNITDLIRSWVSGSEPNYGMLITGDEGPQNNRYRWFYTKEFSNGVYRPFVDVDYTTCTDTTLPFASIEVLPQFSPGSFTVRWSGTDYGGSGISYYNIQVSQNGGSWQTWKSHTTSTSATYNGGNGQTYGFRAQAVDKCGNVQGWTNVQAWTTVDTVAPQARVNDLPEYTLTPTFSVSWSGDDNPGGSGIANYDIDVRLDQGDWIPWLRGVTYTSATFTNAENLITYKFRARATDRVGNVQPFGSNAQAQTLVVLQPYSWMEPISPSYINANIVTVNWTGVTVPDTSINRYDIRYRYNGGAWVDWNTYDGGTTSTDFTFPNVDDGLYEFEVRAHNDAGQIEPWTGLPEAFVYCDRQEPHFALRGRLPTVNQTDQY